MKTLNEVAAGVRRLVIVWLAAWPTITVLLAILAPLIESWPLPIRTLILTALMVPIMQLWVVPFLSRLITRKPAPSSPHSMHYKENSNA